jgi:GNAT superfamily N-acetyltransferase
LIADTLQQGFATYRSWAPAQWEPPTFTADALRGLEELLGRDDVWCVIAVSEAHPIGHVALAPFTREESAPAAAGAVYLWQLFVRPRWQGQGIATWLMEAALSEADRRGFTHSVALDSARRSPGASFLRARGLGLDRPGS